jgi:integrase
MKTPKRKVRPDGRIPGYVFLGYHADGSENRKWAYAKTDKELEKKLFAIKLTAAKGELLDDETVTVKEWGETWLKTYKTGKEYKTYQMYENVLDNHIIKELGHMKLKDLKPFHVQGLINSRKAQGLTRTLDILKLTLKQIFEQAIENDYMIKNPARKIEMPSKEKKLKRSLTDDELKIVKSTQFTNKEKAFLFILLYAGLRRGEALALTKKDIDFKAGVIKVNKVIVFKNNRPELKTYTKTEAGMREITIVDKLKAILKPYVESMNSIILFQPQTSKGYMTETSFRSMWAKIWRTLNKQAGGKHDVIAFAKDVTPHILRHTYATMLYYAGVDIKQAQYLLGHSSAEVTLNLYTHLDKKKSAPTEKLNAYLA